MKELKELRIKNLDSMYSTIKSELGKLELNGYDAQTSGYEFSDGSDTLIKWFINNLNLLKSGVEELEIALATGTGEYSNYPDSLTISTAIIGRELAVMLDRTYCEECIMAGNYKLEHHQAQHAFLLQLDINNPE